MRWLPVISGCAALLVEVKGHKAQAAAGRAVLLGACLHGRREHALRAMLVGQVYCYYRLHDAFTLMGLSESSDYFMLYRAAPYTTRPSL